MSAKTRSRKDRREEIAKTREEPFRIGPARIDEVPQKSPQIRLRNAAEIYQCSQERWYIRSDSARGAKTKNERKAARTQGRKDKFQKKRR
jgi:hypothetical protein